MVALGSWSKGLCITSPTTPTIVIHGFFESAGPSLIRLPIGDSPFHQVRATFSLTSATFGASAPSLSLNSRPPRSGTCSASKYFELVAWYMATGCGPRSTCRPSIVKKRPLE